jgi:hypothetical protein
MPASMQARSSSPLAPLAPAAPRIRPPSSIRTEPGPGISGSRASLLTASKKPSDGRQQGGLHASAGTQEVALGICLAGPGKGWPWVWCVAVRREARSRVGATPEPFAPYPGACPDA